MWAARGLLLLGLAAMGLGAGELRLGVGVFFFAPEGADVQLTYRFTESRWAVGLRHLQWTDTFHDPFTGRALSDTRSILSGLLVQYHFTPGWKGSWYLAGGVLQLTKEETSLFNGDSSKDQAMAPAFGGGYTRTMGKHFFWNLGMLLAPGVELKTQTSTGSEEDTGGFDIQVQVGVRF